MPFKYPGNTSISEFTRILNVIKASIIYVNGELSLKMNNGSTIKLELV